MQNDIFLLCINFCTNYHVMSGSLPDRPHALFVKAGEEFRSV